MRENITEYDIQFALDDVSAKQGWDSDSRRIVLMRCLAMIMSGFNIPIAVFTKILNQFADEENNHEIVDV